MKVDTIVPHKPFRFSGVQLAQLRAVLEESPGAGRFIGDIQRIVSDHLETKRASNIFRPIESIRAHARAIQKGAGAMARQLSQLQAAEKELLGQLMWVTDRNYYPAAFSVEYLAESLRVLGAASAKMAHRDKGGTLRLQLGVLIRDVNSAYTTRFNRRPKITAARANDFTAAFKICLKAAGEPLPTSLLSLIREALGL